MLVIQETTKCQQQVCLHVITELILFILCRLIPRSIRRGSNSLPEEVDNATENTSESGKWVETAALSAISSNFAGTDVTQLGEKLLVMEHMNSVMGEFICEDRKGRPL